MILDVIIPHRTFHAARTASYSSGAGNFKDTKKSINSGSRPFVPVDSHDANLVSGFVVMYTYLSPHQHVPVAT